MIESLFNAIAADDKLFIQEELDNFKRRAIAAGFNHSSQTIKILNYLLHYISK